MSFLFIDTHKRGLAAIEFVDEGTAKVKEMAIKPGRLMAVLSRKVDKQKLADASGVILVSGPGPFSSIRAGVLIGNLLARIFNKPLYQVSAPLKAPIPVIINSIKTKRIKPSKYVSPIYDAEANITLPKKI